MFVKHERIFHLLKVGTLIITYWVFINAAHQRFRYPFHKSCLPMEILYLLHMKQVHQKHGPPKTMQTEGLKPQNYGL